MKIEAALQGVSSILLDTAPAVYHLEKNPVFGNVMDRFFQFRAAQGITLVTTPVTLAECLMIPIRENRSDLEAAYNALLIVGQATVFRTIGADEATAAARLRGKYGLKLADAMQAAVAVQANCQALLTNDKDLKKITEVRVLLVSELEV
jgi:predicted nucleic acid-binding protein